MNEPPEIKAQLERLRIPKDQRPEFDFARRRGKRRGRWLVACLVLAALGAGGYLKRQEVALLLNPSAGAAEIPLMKVTLRQGNQAPPVLTATGKVVSDHRVQVATKVSGQIIAMFFEQGDRVKQGQLLARIEDVTYRARRDEAAAMLSKAKANLEFQKYNHDRTAGLFKEDTAPKIEFADAQRAWQEAQAQVQAAQAGLDLTQKTLNDCQVLAPISGVILERNVEVGDFVSAEGGRGANANAQFGLIADMTKLRVEVDVSELDIARIKTGMPCTIVPEAYKDRRYEGHVLWIDPGANYAKATVQVKVRIENPDDHLRVEGSSQVAFLADAPTSAPATQESPSVWIPSSACLLDPSGTVAQVFVVADGRLKKTTVTIGRRSGGQVEVTAGLTQGESIAADRLDKLSDGQRVPS